MGREREQQRSSALLSRNSIAGGGGWHLGTGQDSAENDGKAQYGWRLGLPGRLMDVRVVTGQVASALQSAATVN